MVCTSLEKIRGLLTYGLIQTADWNSELASLNYSAREKWHRLLTLPGSCPFCFDQKAIRDVFFNAVVMIFLFEYLSNLAITLYHELRVGGWRAISSFAFLTSVFLFLSFGKFFEWDYLRTLKCPIEDNVTILVKADSERHSLFQAPR